jgi:tetrahydromethanopterin S-methyltransferase subunit G
VPIGTEVAPSGSVAGRLTDARFGTALALEASQTRSQRSPRSVGRILLGVVIGVILVIWLLASCIGAIF